jgi:DNA-binding response OmpR family regulator
VPLTSREFDLMRCLVAAEGAMVSKADLLDAMGYGSADGGFHRIESMLTRLRRKTQDYAGMPLPVRAVFGRGLVFVA